MHIFLRIPVLLITAFAAQAQAQVTEKLAANTEKIAHINQQINSGKLTAQNNCDNKCGRTCKACGSWNYNASSKCDARGGCSVKA